jgi:hypothetical protein
MVLERNTGEMRKGGKDTRGIKKLRREGNYSQELNFNCLFPVGTISLSVSPAIL